MNVLLVINKNDNVATALDTIYPGCISILGERKDIKQIIVPNKIRSGHKVALLDLEKGQEIIKYGIIIGLASMDIKKGEWIHLHNVESKFDERSGTLDSDSGAPTDSIYI